VFGCDQFMTQIYCSGYLPDKVFPRFSVFPIKGYFDSRKSRDNSNKQNILNCKTFFLRIAVFSLFSPHVLLQYIISGRKPCPCNSHPAEFTHRISIFYIGCVIKVHLRLAIPLLLHI